MTLTAEFVILKISAGDRSGGHYSLRGMAAIHPDVLAVARTIQKQVEIAMKSMKYYMKVLRRATILTCACVMASAYTWPHTCACNDARMKLSNEIAISQTSAVTPYFSVLTIPIWGAGCIQPSFISHSGTGLVYSSQPEARVLSRECANIRGFCLAVHADTVKSSVLWTDRRVNNNVVGKRNKRL